MITFPSHRQMPIGGFVYQTGHASQAGRDWRGVEAKIPIKLFFQISWREICTTWQLAALVSWTLFGLSLGSSWTHGLGTISSPSSLIFSPIDAREHPWPLWQCSHPSAMPPSSPSHAGDEGKLVPACCSAPTDNLPQPIPCYAVSDHCSFDRGSTEIG